MSVEQWLIFSALCAALFLYPSRFNLLVAKYSSTRGLVRGLMAAFGAAIAACLALTIGFILALALQLYAQSIHSLVTWLGVSWLILSALWTIGTPPLHQALADNDNLPGKNGFIHVFIEHASSLRFVFFFAALLVQFPAPPAHDVIKAANEFQLATLAIALISYGLIALFPNGIQHHLRAAHAKIRARRAGPKTIIHGKSVSARYRKIAA